MNHFTPRKFGIKIGEPDDANPLTPTIEMCESIASQAPKMTSEQHTAALAAQVAVILTASSLLEMLEGGILTQEMLGGVAHTIAQNAIATASHLGASDDDLRRLCRRMGTDVGRSLR